MPSLSYLLALVLLCFSCTQTSTQTQAPKPLTVADLQKLRWIEGSWRGSGDKQDAFFERYRFEKETTLAVDSLAGSVLQASTEYFRQRPDTRTSLLFPV